jgi:uncharacterized protein
MTDTTRVLILPGIGDSGPAHWQSLWQANDATMHRVQQREWDAPACADWVDTLDAAVASESGPLVFAAHSSACGLIAHWLQTASAEAIAKIRGALLVAPSDPDGPHYPIGPTGFGPMPMTRLPFATIVVASDDDIYATVDHSRRYATAWGAEFVLLPQAGHINASSGHGAWPQGYALLQRLRGE